MHEGECPSCGAEVEYEAWLPVAAEGAMACPVCGDECDVDEVYPEIDE